MRFSWPVTGEWPQADPETITTFGNRLRIARKARGLSQPKLAKLAKCTQATISQIESGRVADLQSALMFRISDALSVSARWLVWGTGPVHKWEILAQDEKSPLEGYRRLPEPLKDHAQRVISSLLTASAPPSTANPFPPPAPKKR